MGGKHYGVAREGGCQLPTLGRAESEVIAVWQAAARSDNVKLVSRVCFEAAIPPLHSKVSDDKVQKTTLMDAGARALSGLIVLTQPPNLPIF